MDYFKHKHFYDFNKANWILYICVSLNKTATRMIGIIPWVSKLVVKDEAGKLLKSAAKNTPRNIGKDESDKPRNANRNKSRT